MLIVIALAHPLWQHFFAKKRDERAFFVFYDSKFGDALGQLDIDQNRRVEGQS